MWYIAFTDDAGEHQIGYATSADGITWTDYNANPVLVHDPASTWYNHHTDLPVVIKEDNTYKMWFTGGVGATVMNSRPQIGFTTSSDGITWDQSTLSEPIIALGGAGEWDSAVIGSADVQKINGEYKVIYGGSNLTTAFGFGVATLNEGVVGLNDQATQEHSSFYAYETLQGVNLLYLENINETAEIFVHNSVGQLVYKNTVEGVTSGETLSIPVSKKGIYFVKVVTGSSKESDKVIIK